MTKLTGYIVAVGYVGIIDGKKMLFPTEQEFVEYRKEYENDKNDDCTVSRGSH